MATGLLTLPFLASYGTPLDEAPRTRKAEFGEGYTQRSGDGPNAIKQKWAVDFGQRSDADAQDIIRTFRKLGATTPFWWKPPGSDYTVNRAGFGVGDGARTIFQLWRAGIVQSQVDWQGVWPVYDKYRVNMGQRTEDVSSAAWIKLANGTGTAPIVTANYGVAPDGFSMTADRVQHQQGSGTTASDYSLIQIQAATSPVVVPGQVYSMSMWMKTTDGSTQTIYLVFPGWTGYAPTTMQVTGTWQRFMFPNLTCGTVNNVKCQLGCRGTFTPANSVADLMMFGFQLEAGPNVTKYIPNPNTTALAEVPTYSVAGGMVMCDHPTSEPTIYLNDWNGESLLYKTARTNILLQSQVFESSAWVKNNTQVTVNATTAPDGTTTADKVADNATGGTVQHYIYQATTGNLIDNNALVFSVYAKAAEYTKFQMRIVGKDGVILGLGLFDLTAGTFTPSTGSPGGGITLLANGWYRCWVTMPTIGTGASASNCLIYLDSGSGNSYVGTAGSGLYFWQGQAENLGISVLPGATFVPSYPINTTTVAVTVTDYSITSTGQVTMGYVLPASTPALPVYLTWSGTGDGQRQFICESYKRGFDTFNTNKVSCVFEEDFT